MLQNTEYILENIARREFRAHHKWKFKHTLMAWNSIGSQKLFVGLIGLKTGSNVNIFFFT